MLRRNFLKFFSFLFLGWQIKPEKIELQEMTTSNYRFMLRDIEERFFINLYNKTQAIGDCCFESKDGSYPQHYQMTKQEEAIFLNEHGFKPTYYWRKWAGTAKNFLRGNIEKKYTLLDTKDSVKIYRHYWGCADKIDYDRKILELYYVFLKDNAVGHLGWPLTTKEGRKLAQ